MQIYNGGGRFQPPSQRVVDYSIDAVRYAMMDDALRG